MASSQSAASSCLIMIVLSIRYTSSACMGWFSTISTYCPQTDCFILYLEISNVGSLLNDHHHHTELVSSSCCMNIINE
jgi:hypothetical protein